MKKLVSILLILCLCLSLAACGGSKKEETKPAEEAAPAENAAPAEEAKPAEEAAPAATEVPENPENKILRLGAANDWTSEGMNLVFDTLTYRINSTQASKQLIDVSHNEDYTEYTLKVTPGIEFSDGTPLDANCIKYSIENESLATTLGFHTLMESLEIVDDMTLVAKFPSPYATFEYELSYILAVKEGAVSPEGNIVEYIGTGMYVVEDFEPGTSCTFKYNENYWNTEHKPSVTTVEYKVIPDIPTRVMALENKEVDVIGITEHGGFADYPTLNQLKDQEGIQIDFRAGGSPSMYMFNYVKGPTTDINLRKAISLAIDRQRLCDTICFGFATPAYTYILDTDEYAPTNGVKFHYDVEEAKKLLADGGYEDTDNDGILEKDGENIVLSLVTLSSETYRNTAVLVKEDLEKIGIGVEIEALDAQGYYAKSQVGEFDMCFTHPWKEPVTYYTWRCTYSDYDTMGTGFGFDPKFKDYFDVVSAGLDKEAIQDFFDMFWDESYEFVPAVTLFSGGMARVYTDEVSGLAWQRGHGTLNLIDLSNVVVNRK